MNSKVFIAHIERMRKEILDLHPDWDDVDMGILTRTEQGWKGADLLGLYNDDNYYILIEVDVRNKGED